MECRKHGAHGTAYDEDWFGFNNEMNELIAFLAAVEIPWFAVFVIALYVNGMSLLQFVPCGEFHDARRRVDFRDEVAVEGSNICFVMLLSCVEEESDFVVAVVVDGRDVVFVVVLLWLFCNKQSVSP